MFVALDGKRLRHVFGGKKTWRLQDFEFRTIKPGEHGLSFSLRENPVIAIDTIQTVWTPISELKPLFPDTPLSREGKPAAVIIASAGEPWAAEAERLQSLLRTRWRLDVPISAAAPADRSRAHLLALGHSGNNALLERLAGIRYVSVTPTEPGPDGYVVASVPDPWGMGANVVVVGASEPNGQRRAVDRFVSLVQQKPQGLVFPWTYEVRTKDQGMPVAPSEGFLEHERNRARRWVQTGNHRRLAKSGISYLSHYRATGVAAWGKLGFFMLRLLSHEMNRVGQLKTGFRDAWLWKLVIAWDNVEELPLFTPADRLWMTNYILDLTRDMTKIGYFRKMKPGYLRWNHETVPALGMLWASEYFRKHYGLPEAASWATIARRCFEPQLYSWKPREDSQGYQWGTLRQVCAYSHAIGDRTYFRTGSAVRAAELALMTMDNLGYGSAFGDHGGGTGNGGMFTAAREAARYHRDGRWVWFDRKLTAHLTRPERYEVEPIEPVELTGLRSFPLHREVYRMMQEGYARHPSPPTAKRRETFDKIAFRTGHSADDQYMLIDGYSRGSHGHYDGNAIVRFTDNGRIWLLDCDYIKSQPQYHNSVAFVRDGASELIPPVCALVDLANLTATGFSRTAVRSYNGADWTRSVFWMKEAWFVVFDELKANKPGDYGLRCIWRTLGEPAFSRNELRVMQAERPGVAAIDVEGASGGKAARFLARGGYLKYGVKIPPGKYTLRMIAGAPHAAADSYYVDLDGRRVAQIGVHVGDMAPSEATLEVHAPGAREMRVSLRESPGSTVDRFDFVGEDGRKITIEAEDFVPLRSTPQHFFITNCDGSRLRLKHDAESGRKSWTGYLYAEPVVRILEEIAVRRIERGEAQTFINVLQTTGERQTRLFTPLRLGKSALMIAKGSERCLVALQSDEAIAPVRFLGSAAIISPKLVALVNGRSLSVGPRRVFESSAPVSIELRWQDGRGVLECGERTEAVLDIGPMTRVTLDGEPLSESKPIDLSAGRHVMAFSCNSREIVFQMEKALDDLWRKASNKSGAVVPLARRSADGLRTVWTKRTKADVRSLVSADLDGDGSDELLCGDRGGLVATYHADGEKLWQFSAGGEVRDIAVGDLDGDGRPGVLVGSADEHLYALTAGGRELWRYEFDEYRRRRGRPVSVFTADLDGDNRREVIVGAENWQHFAFSGSGKLLWKFESVHGSTVGTAADLDGDGRDEVVAGTEYYWWHVLAPTGRKQWGVSHGPNCTAVWAGDLDGDGRGEVLFGSADSNIYLHVPKLRHKTVWQQSLGGPVTGLAVTDLDGDGKKEIVAASEGFNVFAFDAAGKPVWRSPMPDCARTLCLADLDGDGRMQVAVGCDDGTILVLDARGNVVARKSVGRPVSHVVAMRAGDRTRIAFAAGKKVGLADGQR